MRKIASGNWRGTACALVAAAGLSAVAAGPYYLSSSGSSQNGAQLDNPGMWEDAGGTACTAFDDTADYYVGAGRIFSTRYGYHAAESVFPGGPLTIGDIAGAKNGFLYLRGDSLTTFPRGVKLARGQALNNYAVNVNQQVAGDVEVLATASSPFQLWSYYANDGQTWKGDFKGSASASLLVGGNACKQGFRFTASGSWAEYLGTLTLRKGTVNPLEYDTTYEPQTSCSFPGSLVMETGTVLAPAGAGDVLTVKALSLAAGTKLTIAATASASSRIVVTNSFTCAGAVLVDASQVASTKTDAGRTVAVLTVPVSSDLTESMFALDAATASANGFLKVDGNGDGTKSLKVVFNAIVKQTVSDSGSHQNRQASSLLNAAHWSDGELPHSGADYFVQPINNNACHLHTPLDTDYEFPGESLTFKGWCYFYSWGRTFTCKRLVLKDKARIYMGNNGGVTATTRFDGGEICLESGVVRLSAWNSFRSPVVLASYLTGSAELKLSGVYSTSYPQGETYISALNTNFAGTITVDLAEKDSSITPGDSTCQTLYVNDGRNVGGPLAAFDYKALSLSQYARLAVSNVTQVTFEDGVNRGIFVGDVGRMVAGDGQTMCIRRPLTVDGKLRKEGAGVLELASEVGFLADGARTAEPPADATKRVLEVNDGALKVSHADAVNGLTATVADGAKIVLDVAAADPDLVAYGIRNVKTATPFATAGGAGKVRIEFYSPDEPDFASKTLAMMTVRSDCADAAHSLVAVAKSASLGGYAARISRVDREIDGVQCTTFMATIVRKGITISFK